MNFILRLRFAFLIPFLTMPLLQAGELKPILLWPKGAPGDHEPVAEEKDTTSERDGLVAGRRVIRLGNVTKPTVTLYTPSSTPSKAGPAVLVCPGGAYHILAMDLEGTEVCEWLNSIGITAGLLKYRVPPRAGQADYVAPLQDAQRALSLIRQHAKEWNLDPKHIGVLGFSAGGHLSASLSTNNEKRSYESMDEADSSSCRPDFTVLVYPAYLSAKGDNHLLRKELKVTANTPPAFIVQTQDDGVGVNNSIDYYIALTQAQVPAELHLYPSGGHGYGLRKSEKPVTQWPGQVERWLREVGILGK
ncbi:MAG: Xylanase [Verrucomicrobiales bacterium]|nr:Xylanase [Verrucomicrobiales bacterium]